MTNQQKKMKPKACFIENDFEIDSDMGNSALFLIEDATQSYSLTFDRLFNIIVTGASQRPKDVWDAIVASDYIFMSTAFIGDSGRLFELMCEMAISKGIKDKTIVNFRNSDAYLHLSDKGFKMLHKLMDKNNVKYISQDTPEFVEICKQLIP